MANKPTLAITGANGLLGTELVSYFSSKGWSVVGLVRNPAEFQSTKTIKYKAYDMDEKLSVDSLSGVDYLVHTAYIKHAGSKSNAKERNVSASRNLLAACNKAGITHSVFISSMSVHKDATSVYSQQKLEIEKLFSSHHSTILRCGLILGNGGIVKNMLSFMRSKHLVPLIGNGKQPIQTIAVYDVARVIERVLTANKSGLYTVATPEVYSYREFYQKIGKRFNVKFIFLPIPYWLLSWVLNIAEFLHIPLSAGKDNLDGLKNLKSAKTEEDLKRLDLKLDDLDKALEKIVI